jgi:integrase
MSRTPIEKYEVVEKFLMKVTKKPGTRTTYRSYLNRYFKELGVTDQNSYFTSGRNYVADIEKVVFAIEKIPDRTQQSMLSCVKRFMEKNEIEVKANQWEEWITRNDIGRPQAVTDDKIPTNKDLKILMEYAIDIKTRALTMFLASSGLRIGEALQITVKMFNDDRENNHIKIPSDISKTHRIRHVFYTNECKEVLDNWLKVREKYIDTKYSKSVYARENKRATDNRLFPFAKDNAIKTWNRLLERAGDPYNEKDNNEKLDKPRYKYHIHTIRKHWFSSLLNQGMNANFVNYIGGHESLLESRYSDMEKQPELLKKSYDEYSNSLLVFSTPTDLTGINKEIATLKEDNKELKEDNQDLRKDMEKLMRKLAILTE